MSKRVWHGILPVLICALVFVSIAAAHEITIGQLAKIGNGQTLEPGTYQVEVEKMQGSAEVLFFQGGELVVTARAILTKEGVKCNNTEIHSEEVDGTRVITKMWLRGWKESLVFKQGAPEAE
jgi:hypothetical protein